MKEQRKTYNERGQKWCYKCRQYLDTYLFSKRARNADGLEYVCKPCQTGNPLDLGTPVIDGQMNWKYERPDAYDIYMQNRKK